MFRKRNFHFDENIFVNKHAHLFYVITHHRIHMHACEVLKTQMVSVIVYDDMMQVHENGVYKKIYFYTPLLYVCSAGDRLSIRWLYGDV